MKRVTCRPEVLASVSIEECYLAHSSLHSLVPEELVSVGMSVPSCLDVLVSVIIIWLF